jgi:hypothetical protein
MTMTVEPEAEGANIDNDEMGNGERLEVRPSFFFSLDLHY